MKTYQFKTSIKCSGCIEKVTPFLNAHLAPGEWEVDIYTPAKILTVTSDDVTPEAIEQVVKEAGFEVERIVG